MSLKQEIETWVTALAAYDNNEFDSAIRCFEQIADTSKILFNCGVIHATLGEHTRAVECYQRATHLDQYLAIAYFQQGVSNFLMGDFEEALANFNDTLLYLRGNNNIDYEQLGLKFKLYSCEVLFNRGLCYIYLQQKDPGMQDLVFALKEKVVPDHDVIDEAIREEAEGYTVFSIPVGVVYRPNEAKVKNLKKQDYLGKARLVASFDQQLMVDPRRQAALAALGVDDRPGEKLSYAALNLVRPDLRSRANRQQSEPPRHRQVFPPTPPPELERPESAHGKRRSTDSTNSERSSLQQSRPGAKPLRLELGVAAFEHKSHTDRPRLQPKRSESERPAMRREPSNAPSKTADSRRREHRSSYRDVPEVRIKDDPIEAYSEQAYQQQAPLHQRSRSSAHHSQPFSIEEEEEEDDEETLSPLEQPLAFEILPPKHSNYPRHRSQSRRAPDVRKVRVKVHAEDMRYVMTAPTVSYEELFEQIRVKFGFKTGFKLKIKDEDGDMVTMADQDDLDMAMGTCKAAAAKDMADMGKMEVWVHEI
ncbi:related to NADPH oxidase cytosolic protein p67phox [Ramularia collo-cygni]|uniref:Related to NADPH oxidase cytosolic protein p67phox n=1 Tax=Ramularia collo-cygni TaxID=112498 RepID=A0A2D3UXP2_9PEZI|nr:related to NADPH oxidase cytosolic protein p67phox [Ramularia collo-cygni]CZT15916.1 related to NADPH oxidase cytosolic protein p67phox [Ramularia collo-cygni]